MTQTMRERLIEEVRGHTEPVKNEYTGYVLIEANPDPASIVDGILALLMKPTAEMIEAAESKATLGYAVIAPYTAMIDAIREGKG